MKKLMLSAFLVLLVVNINAQSKWAIDKAHSKVQFTVTHLIISEATGQFQIYDGNIETSKEDFSDAKIDFSIDVASINTDNSQRDNHLKSDDFFNAEKFSKMVFNGKSMQKLSGNKYKLTGNLTIRDVTKTVVLDVVYNGTVKDPRGNTKAGFKVTGSLDRFDYNLKWNALMEAGGAVVGKTVNIIINLQLAKS